VSKRALPILCLAFALAIGGLARKGALDAGFLSDDYLHYAMLRGAYPLPRQPFDLFRFAGGGAQETSALTAFGYYPWWTHADFRLSMLRPLASLSHAFDYAVLRTDARAHHVHSLLWWMLCVAAVSALLFELLPPLAAGAATLLFALDESHSVPLLWIANRSLLMATAFGTAALLMHVRHRASRTRASRLASIALFALALACGEYALPLLGYLCCLELVDPVSGVSRRRALAPFLALGLCFALAVALLGYGAAHSALYTSPIEDPVAYARKLIQGVPVLLGDLLLAVPADQFTFGAADATGPESPALLSKARLEQIGVGVIGGVLAAGLWRGARRGLAPEHARTLDWLVAAIPVALLPVLGSFITTRLVLPANIGCAALFGCALMVAGRALRDGVGAGPRSAGRALVAVLVIGGVLFLHVHRAAIQTYDATGFYAAVARARSRVPLDAAIDDLQIARQRVILVAAADANDAPYLPFVRFAHGHPLPAAFWLLSGSSGAHELHRIDPTTLEVFVLDGPWPRGGVVGSLTRGDEDPIVVGQRFELPGLRIEVKSTDGHQPRRVRFTFDRPLEDHSLLWLEATPAGLRKLALPAPGEIRTVMPPVLSELVPAPLGA
jgi:hypothetical protein